MATMKDRLINRITTTNGYISDTDADDLIQTVTDRVNLRLGTKTVPKIFESIVVDAAVKMYRRMYYEGIQSENVGGMSNSFITDILSEYDSEFEQYRANGNGGTGGKIVRFL